MQKIEEKSATTRISGGLGWLILASVIWGTVGVSSVLLNRIEAISPLLIGLLRLGFAAPFLVTLAWLSTGCNPFRLEKQERGYYAAMGLAMAIYQVLYFIAIPLASVTLVVVVALCSSPLMVALISIPVFGERLNRTLVMALGLGLVGTMLLAFGGNTTQTIKPDYLLGVILALGTGLAYGTLVVFSRLATQAKPNNPIQPIAVAFSLGALILLPITILTGRFRLDLSLGVWGIGAYLGIVPTGLAYIFFLKGVAKASATIATITTMIEPMVAALLAWWLLGESLTPASLLGSGLLLLSVMLLAKR